MAKTDPHALILDAGNALHDALMAAIDTRAPADTLNAIRNAQVALRKARTLALDDFMTSAGATPHPADVRAAMALGISPRS